MAKLFFKIFAPSQSFHAVDYNEKKQAKENAKLLYFENFGHLQNKSVISKEEFKDYLTFYSGRNKRVKLPQFHAVLSCKGNELSGEQLKGYVLDIMNRLGYADNPILIYEHSDTANHHVHIVTSRINKNGKKINDSFERQRANNILSELLHLEPQEEFARDLAASLLYKCSTDKQFLLLMELKGYKPKLNSQTKNYDFYKHGKLQGKSSPPTPQRGDFKIEENYRRKVCAIIRYYKEKYSIEPLINENKKSYSKQRYTTALTEHLKKTFGWEFVFFKSSQHEKPYGYVIIDHPNHTVYKGNEMMKLNELLSTNHADNTKPAIQPDKKIFQIEQITDETAKTSVKPVTFYENDIGQDAYLQQVSTEIINEIGNQEIAEADNLAKSNITPKKSKKRFRY
jgi:hypothetical protein